MSRFKKILEKDEEEVVIEPTEQEIINPLCKKCAERVDSSMTTRTDVVCMYGLEPVETFDEKEKMAHTNYKCQKFNPIKDITDI